MPALGVGGKGTYLPLSKIAKFAVGGSLNRFSKRGRFILHTASALVESSVLGPEPNPEPDK